MEQKAIDNCGLRDDEAVLVAARWLVAHPSKSFREAARYSVIGSKEACACLRNVLSTCGEAASRIPQFVAEAARDGATCGDGIGAICAPRVAAWILMHDELRKVKSVPAALAAVASVMRSDPSPSIEAAVVALTAELQRALGDASTRGAKKMRQFALAEARRSVPLAELFASATLPPYFDIVESDAPTMERQVGSAVSQLIQRWDRTKLWLATIASAGVGGLPRELQADASLKASVRRSAKGCSELVLRLSVFRVAGQPPIDASALDAALDEAVDAARPVRAVILCEEQIRKLVLGSNGGNIKNLQARIERGPWQLWDWEASNSASCGQRTRSTHGAEQTEREGNFALVDLKVLEGRLEAFGFLSMPLVTEVRAERREEMARSLELQLEIYVSKKRQAWLHSYRRINRWKIWSYRWDEAWSYRTSAYASDEIGTEMRERRAKARETKRQAQRRRIRRREIRDRREVDVRRREKVRQTSVHEHCHRRNDVCAARRRRCGRSHQRSLLREVWGAADSDWLVTDMQ